MGGVVKGEEFDYFHELVLNQELVRIAARGVADGLQAGMVIGLPPVMNFGPEPLRSKVLEEVFSGQKVIYGSPSVESKLTRADHQPCHL